MISKIFKNADAAQEIKNAGYALLELLFSVFIGLYFYIPLQNPTVATITWITGLLLIINRIITQHQAKSSIHKINQDISKISQLVDIRNSCDIDSIRKLFDTYAAITEPEFERVKNNILLDSLVRLSRLKNDKESDELTTTEYYEWLLPILGMAGKGNSIKAVSCMFDAEWDTSPTEQKFIEGNLEAAARGAELVRIFVTTREVMGRALDEVEPVKLHTEEEYKERKLRGLFVERNILERDNLLKNRVRHGFILFDSRFALIDEFSDDGIRGKVTMNPAKIRILEQTFEQLKMHSSIIKKGGFGNLGTPSRQSHL